MSDNYSVNQPSKAPYVVGGTLVGGLGGAAAFTKWDKARELVSDPAKYNSYEDLLAEAKDEAKFSEAVKGIEDTTFREEVEKFGKNYREAGAKYDADLKAYIEKNPQPTVASPEHENALKKLKEAQDAYNTEREKLIKENIEKLNAENVVVTEGKLTPDAKAVLEEKKKALADAIKREEKLARSMDKDLNKTVNEYLQAVRKYDGVETKEAKEAIGTAYKRLEGEVGAFVKLNNLEEGSKEAYLNYFKSVADQNAYNRAFDPVKTIATERNTAMKAIETELARPDMATIAGRNADAVDKAVQGIKLKDVKLGKLENLAKEFAEFSKTKTPEETKKVIEFMLKNVQQGKDFVDISATVNITEVEEIKKFADVLKDKGLLEDFQRLVGEGNDPKKAIENAINETRAQRNALQKAANTIKSSEAKIVELGGKGAKLENGAIYTAKGHKVSVEQAFSFADGAELPKAPKSKAVATLEKEIAAIEGSAKKTTEQFSKGDIVTKAESMAETALKDKKEAITAADKVVNETKAALKTKPAEEWAKELTEKFVKENGTKEEAVKKVAEDSKESLKKLFERTTHNGKLAGAIAACAVAGLALGALIAPKNKEA